MEDFDGIIEKARLLHGGEILSQYSIDELRSICNGVGASWMDKIKVKEKKFSDIANCVLKWALPATVIHDIRYFVGGDSKARKDADFEFLKNCLILSTDNLLMCFLRVIESLRMYKALRVFGGLAWKTSQNI